MLSEQHRRSLLLIMSMFFAVLGLTNTQIIEERWLPQVVAVLAFGAAICFGTLAFFPRSVWAFRTGGTLAIGALLFRAVSVLVGVLDAGFGVALATANTAVTGIAVTLFGCWWLVDVKAWHEDWKRRPR